MKTLKAYYKAQVEAEKLNVPYPKRTVKALRAEIAEAENRMATLSPDELMEELVDLGKGHSITEVNGPFGKYFMTGDGGMSVGDDRDRMIRQAYSNQIRILHQMSDELILPTLPSRAEIKDTYSVDELSALSKERFATAKKAGMSDDGANEYAMLDPEYEKQQVEVNGDEIRVVDLYGKIRLFSVSDIENDFGINLTSEEDKKEVGSILVANLELSSDVEEGEYVSIESSSFNDAYGDMEEDLQERFGHPQTDESDEDEEE
jgi:hypothetical protein